MSWWGAYECLACGGVAGEGTCFDVRFDQHGEAADSVSCPVCGKPCELRAQWEADENGYGSRADQNAHNPEHAARLVSANRWAMGEWIRIRPEHPPRSYGRYVLMTGSRDLLKWHRPSDMGYVAMDSVTGSHQSWESFCRGAQRRGLRYMWSEPLPEPDAG